MADLTLSGCTIIDKQMYYLTRFNTGIFAYLKEEAQEGILTKIFIKNVAIGANYSIVYKDTFNEIWLESELCSLDEANALITQFNEVEANLPNCRVPY